MVDLSFLRSFTKDNPVKMKRYISMYLNIAPETFNRMESNLHDENWTDLAINAHSLKPQVDYMGIASLKEALVQIETKAKRGNVNDMESLFTQAKEINDMSGKLLKEQMDEL